MGNGGGVCVDFEAMEEAEALLNEAEQLSVVLEDFDPTFPVELAEFYAKKQGIDAADPAILKALAAATQAFLSRVLADARDLTEKATSVPAAPAAGPAKKDEGAKSEEKLTLHLDVLAKVLKEKGVNISGNQYSPNV